MVNLIVITINKLMAITINLFGVVKLYFEGELFEKAYG